MKISYLRCVISKFKNPRMLCLLNCGQCGCDDYTFYPDTENKDLRVRSRSHIPRTRTCRSVFFPCVKRVESKLTSFRIFSFLTKFVSDDALKGVISLYRAGEEKPIGRYKARNKIREEHRSISVFYSDRCS